MIVPFNQSYDRCGVDDRQPAANLVRYDIEASPLQKRGVPVIVPHVVELVMDSRMKKGQFLKTLNYFVSTSTLILKSCTNR
jgi:hypothetical protein